MYVYGGKYSTCAGGEGNQTRKSSPEEIPAIEGVKKRREQKS